MRSKLTAQASVTSSFSLPRGRPLPIDRFRPLIRQDAPWLQERCRLLRALHVPGNPLVLPNAWDTASARAVVAAGFPVVATTSAGVAEALGYDDHEQAPAAEMFAAAARIARSVDVPVTADAERGYGLEPSDLVETLMEAGVAGCNLEDTDHATGALVDTTPQASWLAAVRAAAETRGYELVLNARIDVFLAARDRPQVELVEEALERARAYFEAGADCVYPILLRDEDATAQFVAEAGGPLNLLAVPGARTVAELAEIGVARVSYGPLLFSPRHRAPPHDPGQ
jgi:2-methylisocitrate lyase-like PEP mutase family enzyme